MLAGAARNHALSPCAGSAEAMREPWPKTGPHRTKSFPLYDTGDRKLEWSALKGRSPKKVPGVCGTGSQLRPSVLRRMRGGGSFVRSHMMVVFTPKAYS